MQANDPWADRRSEVREPTNYRGRVFYGADLAAWADCTIRNMSPKGAMLEVASMHPLPKSFVVMNIQDGHALEVSLKWRRSDMAGVRITGRSSLEQAATERLAGLKTIWQGLKGQA